VAFKEMNTMPLSDRILNARFKADLSITDLARKARVPYGTLWNWEAGRCVPPRSSRAFARVARVLSLPKVATAQLR
jgi:DNA-binding transcriptional regulator YiaG